MSAFRRMIEDPIFINPIRSVTYRTYTHTHKHTCTTNTAYVVFGAFEGMLRMIRGMSLVSISTIQKTVHECVLL